MQDQLGSTAPDAISFLTMPGVPKIMECQFLFNAVCDIKLLIIV